MKPVVLPEVTTLANQWTLVALPNNVRESIRFQALSLSILEYSFDNGSTYMRTVGSGEQLFGNFSLENIWFRTASADVVKIMVMDKLY